MWFITQLFLYNYKDVQRLILGSDGAAFLFRKDPKAGFSANVNTLAENCVKQSTSLHDKH